VVIVLNDEERKLWKAADKEAEDINDIVSLLFKEANEKTTFVMPSGLKIPGRRFKDVEVTQLKKRLNKINPGILQGKSSEVTPEQEETARGVIDEYIELSTHIPKEKLAEIGSDKIRLSLLLTILEDSTLTENDLNKFRKTP